MNISQMDSAQPWQPSFAKRSIGWPWRNSFRTQSLAHFLLAIHLPAHRPPSGQNVGPPRRHQQAESGTYSGNVSAGGNSRRLILGSWQRTTAPAWRLGAETTSDVGIVPCVILGADWSTRSVRWRPLKKTPIWIGYGTAILVSPQRRTRRDGAAARENCLQGATRNGAQSFPFAPTPYTICRVFPRPHDVETWRDLRRWRHVRLDEFCPGATPSRPGSRAEPLMGDYVKHCEKGSAVDYFDHTIRSLCWPSRQPNERTYCWTSPLTIDLLSFVCVQLFPCARDGMR